MSQPALQKANGFVVTPDDTGAYMDKVNTGMDSLDRDILSNQLVPINFGVSWERFVADWRSFYATHQPYWMRLSGDVYDQAEVYDKNRDDWRSQFMKLGGVPSAPAGVPPDTGSSMSGAIKFAAVAAGLLAIAWIAHEVT